MDHKIKYIQFEGGTELISKVDFKDWEKTNYIHLYDPFRLYPIPPFLQGPLGVETSSQTLFLMKWVPWTDDVSVTVSIDKILIVTDVALNMQEYYKTSIQKHTDTSIENEFSKSTLPIPEDLEQIEDLEQEIIDSAPENLEELAELLNELTKKVKKRILH